jgi:probable glucitol transport protein GutA
MGKNAFVNDSLNSETNSKLKQNFVTTRLERFMYNIYFFGQNSIYFIVTSFLAVYYTSVLGISATTVGSILLLARIWDALVDPVLAATIERLKFKGGKFKPWVKLATISVPIMTILCFGFSDQLLDASNSVRISYAAVTYLLWGTFYAVADAPAFALSTVITPNPEERTVLLANNQITAIVGILLSIITFPMVLKATDSNYMLSVSIFAIVALVLMSLTRFTKERVKSTKKEPTIKEIFQSVISNKYLKIIVIVNLLANGANFVMTLAPYVASDIYKDPTNVTIILGITILPVVLIAPIIPLLVRKFGKIKLLSIAFGANVALSVLTYFVAHKSFEVFIAISLLKSILLAPQLVIYPMFFADVIEYDCYKNGTRFEAATFATQTFMAKISSALSGGIGMWIIGIAGYKASTSGHVVTQSANTLNAMWATFNLGGAIGSLIALVIFIKFYDLTEEKVKDMSLSNQAKL